MKKAGRQAGALLLFFTVGLRGINVASAVPCAKVQAIFALGDYLIAGANNFIDGSTSFSDFLPCGETFSLKSSGRLTRGRLVFDFLASDLGLPFMPPFVQPRETFEQGVNLGFAGSGVQSTTGLGDGVNPLTTPVSQFQQVAKKLVNDTGMAGAGDLIFVFFFVPRSNDLSTLLGNSPLQKTVSPTEFVTYVLSQLNPHGGTVFSARAREVVGLGIAPLGCSPEAMAVANATNGDRKVAPNKLAEADNEAFLQLVDGLNSQVSALANPFEIIEGLYFRLMELPTVLQNVPTGCGSGLLNGAVRCRPNSSSDK